MKLVVLPFMSNVAPWHGQRNPDPVNETAQQACVHEVESATYCPLDWWMTMIWSLPQFGSEYPLAVTVALPPEVISAGYCEKVRLRSLPVVGHGPPPPLLLE